MRRALIFASLAAAMLLGGCSSAYYSMWEKLGYEKRDLLVSHVEEARDQQEEAKEQFQNALDRFIAVTNFEGGDLESKYRELQSAYRSSEAQAKKVRKEIDDVEEVGEALFGEWEDELEEYRSPELRRASERQLRQTRERYDQLVGAMQAAEARMDPVLAAFHDQVLYLKHNLNARAIASLEDTAAGIQEDVQRLIREMEQSINEANRFIEQMGASAA